MRIVAIPGSLGSRSSNRALLEAVSTLASPEAKVSILDGISELPYFNADLDRDGAEVPAPVARLRVEIAAADALMIATPEYAHGIPGVLKNALDWLVSSPAIVGKPVGLIFGSAGDALFAQASLTEILSTMSARVIPDAVVNFPGVGGKIDGSGKVADPEVLAQLSAAMRALVRAAGVGRGRIEPA